MSRKPYLSVAASLITVLLIALALFNTTSALVPADQADHYPLTSVPKAVAVIAPMKAPSQAPQDSAEVREIIPPQAPHAMALAPKSLPSTTNAPAESVTTTLLMGTHEVKKGESVPGIVHQYLPMTIFMTGSELESALRKANDLKGLWPKPGTTLTIPGYQGGPWLEKPVVVPKDFEVRAVYLTGTMAGSARGLQIIRQWRDAGGNAVVFDIKDSDGVVNVPFVHPLAPATKNPPLRNLAKFTRYVHSLGMHSIARIAIFRDEHMAVHHPELSVHSRRSGEAWKENGKLVWTDPSHPEIWEYNIALARYAAENGSDEVQFDYVRFPAEGDQKDARFLFETTHPDWKRSDVIGHFLEKAHAEMQARGVLLSLDVFGVMAWQRPVDLSHTGQDIVLMAKHCDVLSPMIYPSHFFGMDGYASPGDAPEHFIGESMERFQKITVGTGVVLRPWLQAFAWKTKTYSPAYIVTQVRASKDKGGNGFLFWNARNDYSKPLVAMPEMRATRGKFFRGDEVSDSRKAAKPADTPKPSPAVGGD